jgi:DNA-directed RNA polymerase specialized sigma24 family protein
LERVTLGAKRICMPPNNEACQLQQPNKDFRLAGHCAGKQYRLIQPMRDTKVIPASSCFPTTQWTLIIDVIQKGNDQASQAALNAFCQRYWQAIYHFFRRRGCSHEQAEDYAQNFFKSRILEKWDDRGGLLHTVQRSEQRRFRSFLSTRLWWFLKDQWKVQRTRKAGGAASHIPLDELEQSTEIADPAAFEKFGHEFDRVFAVQTITKAAEQATRSKAYLSYFIRENCGKEVTQEEAAKELDMSVGAFKTGYHGFRNRFREELWKEVAKHAGPDKQEIEKEMKYLLSVFADSAP